MTTALTDTDTGTSTARGRSAGTTPWDLPYSVARVDLLPPEIVTRRHLERVQRGLGAWLALVVLATGGVWWASHSAVTRASEDVAAEQARTTALTAAQSRYAAVPVLLAEVDQVEGARASAMVGDVLWYRYLEAISAAAPEGVWLTDLTITPDVAALASGSPAAATDPLAEPAVATITFTGGGLVQDDVAAWLDALTDVDGFSDARYSLSTSTGESGTAYTQFSSTVGVTADALSHRYELGGNGS